MLCVAGILPGLGQTHRLLTRSIFGVVGSVIVSLLLIGVAAGFTAFARYLVAPLMICWVLYLSGIALAIGSVMRQRA